MVNLTLQDVDNFDRLVKYIETSEYKMTLQTTAGIWKMGMMFHHEQGASGYLVSGSTLSEVLQKMVDKFGKEPVIEVIVDTIENAIRLPAMHIHPHAAVRLPTVHMYGAAVEAQRLRHLDGRISNSERRSFLPPPPRPVTEHSEYVEDQLDH